MCRKKLSENDSPFCYYQILYCFHLVILSEAKNLAYEWRFVSEKRDSSLRSRLAYFSRLEKELDHKQQAIELLQRTIEKLVGK
jgi:hypothetical protein